MIAIKNFFLHNVAPYIYQSKTLKAYKRLFRGVDGETEDAILFLADIHEFAESGSTIHTSDPVALGMIMGRQQLVNHIMRNIRFNAQGTLDNKIAKMMEENDANRR